MSRVELLLCAVVALQFVGIFLTWLWLAMLEARIEDALRR